LPDGCCAGGCRVQPPTLLSGCWTAEGIAQQAHLALLLPLLILLQKLALQFHLQQEVSITQRYCCLRRRTPCAARPVDLWTVGFRSSRGVVKGGRGLHTHVPLGHPHRLTPTLCWMIFSSSSVRLRSSSCLKMFSALHRQHRHVNGALQVILTKRPAAGPTAAAHLRLSMALSAAANNCARLPDCWLSCCWSMTAALRSDGGAAVATAACSHAPNQPCGSHCCIQHVWGCIRAVVFSRGEPARAGPRLVEHNNVLSLLLPRLARTTVAQSTTQ
jgi:hypothetical protein